MIHFKFLSVCFFLFCTLNIDAQLSHDKPESVGLDGTFIKSKVDSIMYDAINQKAFPGAQLLVAKKGKIIFHETYGYHTYDSLQKVALDDVYDLASVTKITGPLPALMKLCEDGRIDLDAPFSKYWTDWKNQKDKKNITLRELLAHQSGIKPYIIFLNEVLKKEKIKKRFMRSEKSKRFSNQFYKNLYIKNRFKNKIYRQLKRVKADGKKEYLYSGIASLIYPQLIENITGIPYTKYIQDNFYTPLGCNTLGYLPMNKNLKNNIVPTEIDTIVRKDLTKNWVHDENAALFGGVSGNAGLFSSALDLAKYMQMLIQNGSYDGKQYFKPETVKEFTRIQYPNNNNRRGLGFDKPLIGNDTLSIEKAYPAPQVSPESFGHSGFTGTFVWADPVHDIVFIFLSNRVYPSRTHRNIYNLNIRPKLQELFYTSLKD